MKTLAALLIVIVIALPVAAKDCGNGLPCGPVPWNLPALPTLESPTPMPTFFLTATPSPTMTPTNFTPSPTFTATFTATATFTPTATPTLTPAFDTEELESEIETLQSIINATPISIDVSGTPVTAADQIATAQPGISDIFGRVKGILGADWGPFTPLFFAFLVSIAVTFFIVAVTYTVPFLGFMFGMIRKIYTAIMDFLPL